LVINKCVTAVKVSNFSGHYLRNRSTLDIGVLGYIGIVWPKEHSPEVWHIPPGTPCIFIGRINLVWLLEFRGCFGKWRVKKWVEGSTTIAPYCNTSLHSFWKVRELYYIFWTFFSMGNILQNADISHVSVILTILYSMPKAYCSLLRRLVLTVL